MNTRHTVFGVGMLGLGAVIALTTLPMTSANFSWGDPSPARMQRTNMMPELTEEQKAEMQTMKAEHERGEMDFIWMRRMHDMSATIALTQNQKADVISQMQEKLLTAFDAGKFTQTQYDEMLANLEKEDFSSAEVHFGKKPLPPRNQ